MLGISIFFGWHLTTSLCKKAAIDETVVGYVTILVVVTAVVGARLLEIAVNYDSYQGRFFSALFSTKQEGLAFYGGFIPAVLVGALYIRSKKYNVWQFADCASPAVGFGLFFTRIGCFLAGCCFGSVTESYPAVTFPSGSPAFTFQVRQYLLENTAASSLPVHPTQLYSSIAGLALGITSLYLLLRKKRYHGQIFWTFVLLYAIFRFMIEFIRSDPSRGQLIGLSTSQWVSMAGFGLALFFLKRLQGVASRKARG